MTDMLVNSLLLFTNEQYEKSFDSLSIKDRCS